MLSHIPGESIDGSDLDLNLEQCYSCLFQGDMIRYDMRTADATGRAYVERSGHLTAKSSTPSLVDSDGLRQTV